MIASEGKCADPFGNEDRSSLTVLALNLERAGPKVLLFGHGSAAGDVSAPKVPATIAVKMSIIATPAQ